jgi:D-sedoheptulose 7-phosphate isomerase
MKHIIEKRLRLHLFTINLVSDFLIERIGLISNKIIDAFQNGKKLILIGNGGSAADAQHIAAELVGKFSKERKALPAIALSVNSSIVTAISNDYGYDKVFQRQVEAIVEKGDIIIGITTSGDSINVIKGIKKAKELGALTIALTGKNGGKIKNYADISIIVPSHFAPHIQEAHITIGHIICDLIEEKLFPSKRKAIFLDRDGTIHEDKGYIYKIEDLKLMPNVIPALKLLQKKGFLLIIVSNQAGVARGYFKKEDVEKFNRHLYNTLAQKGVYIDDFYYCTELESPRRKPNSGMILEAIEDWNINPKDSYLIGDKITDIKAGKRAKCETILISKQETDINCDYKASDLLKAVKWIINAKSQ